MLHKKLYNKTCNETYPLYIINDLNNTYEIK